MVGRIIGHYRILEKLGGGGMGVVYKAEDSKLGRMVALKVLPPERVADPNRKRRFVQEARAASALNHPNIITIYDIDEAEGVHYIAMEHVQGKTLDRLIARHGLRVNEALRYAVQMAAALAKAHSAGIVHRDLKPTNVMVTDDGLVKVLDFGLAKLTEAAPASDAETAVTLEPTTEEGTIVGTVGYMSPEQAEGKAVDARSDIFSFGSVLYEMLTGQRAFQGETKVSTIAAILREEPKPLSQVVEGLPREVERIVKRCLRKDREHRFQTMADLKVALEELKEESDSGELADTTTAEKKRFSRTALAAIAVATVALLAVTAVLIHILWPGIKPPVQRPLTQLTFEPGLQASPRGHPTDASLPTVPTAAATPISGCNRSAAATRSKSPTTRRTTGSPTGHPTASSLSFARSATAADCLLSLRWVGMSAGFRRSVFAPAGRRTARGFCFLRPRCKIWWERAGYTWLLRMEPRLHLWSNSLGVPPSPVSRLASRRPAAFSLGAHPEQGLLRSFNPPCRWGQGDILRSGPGGAEGIRTRCLVLV